jgi:hypothetical protein
LFQVLTVNRSDTTTVTTTITATITTTNNKLRGQFLSCTEQMLVAIKQAQ